MSTDDSRNRPFITDFGRSQRAIDVLTGRELMYLPRYAAWCFDPGRMKMQVAECHDLLPYLQIKYSVPDSRVFLLPTSGAV